MLLKTSETQSTPTKRVEVSWGKNQIEYLKREKVVILRALSFEWVKQMFIMDPHKGRRLWFEVVSFSSPAPFLESLLCQYAQSEVEAFYRVDYYSLPGIVSFYDYLDLMDHIASDLSNNGYSVHKHVAKTEDFKLELPNGMVGGAILSKPTNIDSYRELIPEYASGYTQLDEMPTSVFTMSLNEIFNKNGT